MLFWVILSYTLQTTESNQLVQDFVCWTSDQPKKSQPSCWQDVTVPELKIKSCLLLNGQSYAEHTRQFVLD